MKMSRIIPPGGNGYWYLASPFTNYPDGHEQAWLDISRVRGELMQQYGIWGYSPICETYGAVAQLKMPVDHVFWQGDNESKMIPAVGIIMVKLESWEGSNGMARERKWFEVNRGLESIVWLDP